VTKQSAAPGDDFLIGVSFRVLFSPRGDALLSCGKRTVILWDVAERKKRWETTSLKDPSELAISPDGSRVAAKNTAGRVLLLDARDGSVVRTLDKGRGEGAGPVFGADGNALVHGSWDGDLFVHDLVSGEDKKRTYEGEMIRAIHRHDARWIVVRTPTTGSPRGGDRVAVYEGSVLGEPSAEFELADLSHTAISPDGRFLVASRSHHGEIALVKIADGSVVATAPAKFGGTGAAIRWSGERVGSIQEGRVELYRPASLERTASVDLVYPADVAFSPDGSVVALGSWSEGVVKRLAALGG
jgi:WD40 repeat protein